MKNSFLIIFLSISGFAFGQKSAPENWFLLDPKVNSVYGLGSEQAYKTLTGKTPKTVIVAVIDSGIDVEHEDLKEVIWINPGETAGNGIDDDKNGYIDDVHGWSFLGGKNGDINYESTELARMYHRLGKKYKAPDESTFSPEDAKEYEEFKKIRQKFLNDQAQKEQQLKGIDMVTGFLEKVKKKNNGKLTKDALKNYSPENELEGKLKKGLKLAFTFGLSATELEDQLKHGHDQLYNMVSNNKLNSDSIREYIVGDNPNDPNERFYGNNNVKGPDALHGSHVAGIIAAIRDNKVGIRGVSNNVKIMVLRAVPNGDERDKDIANAIRYAVDNGASIVNMSFGKDYSPDKKIVDEAIKYAMSKDVLLIHAAGNDSKNCDLELSFPNRELTTGEMANNWINVGASGYKSGKSMLGTFSNYGKTKVDLFAPGVNIYSTVPDSKYNTQSGTSMAAPAVSGAAAIIRAYFPELKANEVKDLLMKSVVKYKKTVNIPGPKKEKSKVSKLCVSGGFINVNNAVREQLGLNKKK